MSDTEAEKEIDRLLSIFSDFPDGDEIPGVKLGWLRSQAARIAALETEIVAARDAAVQVKPLEWCESLTNLFVGKGLFGETYHVCKRAEGWGAFQDFWEQRRVIVEAQPSIEAAKAAAQADYEQAILALREAPAPDPVGEAARVLLAELEKIEPANREQFFAVQTWLQNRLHSALAGEGE